MYMEKTCASTSIFLLWEKASTYIFVMYFFYIEYPTMKFWLRHYIYRESNEQEIYWECESLPPREHVVWLGPKWVLCDTSFLCMACDPPIFALPVCVNVPVECSVVRMNQCPVLSSFFTTQFSNLNFKLIWSSWWDEFEQVMAGSWQLAIVVTMSAQKLAKLAWNWIGGLLVLSPVFL